MRQTLLLAIALTVGTASLVAQSAPVPRPFPGSGSQPQPATPQRPPETAAPPPASVPAAARPAAPAEAAPTPPAIGVPIYPAAEYIDTYDAGSGQQYVLYGTNASYTDIVNYYRTTLKNGGNQVQRAPLPPAHQFDLGRFQQDRMAFPPSVVVKDYTWNSSPGYLHVTGTTEKRYKTVIQVVAPGPAQ